MDFGEILTKAWQILWKFKVLWIFGLFAGFSLSSGRTATNFSYSYPSTNTTNLPPELSGMINSLNALLRSIPGWAWVLVVVVTIFLGLLALLLEVIGQIGLVRGAWLADSGTPSLKFASLFQQSMGYFWRVLGVDLLIGAPAVIFALLGTVGAVFSILPLFSNNARDAGGGVILLLCILLPLCCLMVPLLLLLGLVGQMALTAVVGEDLGVIAAIKRGWGIFRHNLGKILLMGIMLYLINLVATWLIGIPAAIFAIPMVGGVIGRSGGLLWLGFAGLLCVFFPFALLCNSLVQVYIHNAWTLFYRRLTITPPPSAPVVPPAPLDSPLPPVQEGIDLLPPAPPAA